MASDFSPISFFQRTPNVLLGRYFQDRHSVSKDVAFAELDDSGSTAGIIFEAFSGLPEPENRGRGGKPGTRKTGDRQRFCATLRKRTRS